MKWTGYLATLEIKEFDKDYFRIVSEWKIFLNLYFFWLQSKVQMSVIVGHDGFSNWFFFSLKEWTSKECIGLKKESHEYPLRIHSLLDSVISELFITFVDQVVQNMAIGNYYSLNGIMVVLKLMLLHF